MKAVVLSLDRRPDRKHAFEMTNSMKLDYKYFHKVVDGHQLTYDDLISLGYDTEPKWRDPIEKSHLTKGEVGCCISHINAWSYCVEIDEPLIILEDDAILTDRFSVEEIEKTFDNEVELDFLYLGWKEMGQSEPINDTFVTPDYPYWGLAYVLTPKAAKILLDGDIKQNMIPVDEYLPMMVRQFPTHAYKVNVVEQRNRSDSGSDITTGSRYDAMIDFHVHALTMGTEESRCLKLYSSSACHGFEFVNLGKGKKWIGGDMLNGCLGGGQKLRALKKYLKNLPDRDVVFFCDAYDVFLTDSLNEIIYRYLEIGHDVICGAEKICWPDDRLAEQTEKLNAKHFPDMKTDYQYLNSGTIVGRVGILKQILSKLPKNDESDQLWMQKIFLSEKFDIVLDRECYLFQTHEPKVYKEGDQLVNPITKCYTCLYHGNGGQQQKQLFQKKFQEFYGTSSPIIYTPTKRYEKLSDDIILIDYLTPYMCDSLIELSERHGGYKNLEGDDVPAHEMRLKELQLWDVTAQYWENHVKQIVSEYWECCSINGLRDAFIIKYTMNGQKTLRLHSDISLVSGSVKLNDEYEGGELYFPRQNFSNKDVPVGKCILFPSQVTHPHTSTELLSGTKWSLTMWTNNTVNT